MKPLPLPRRRHLIERITSLTYGALFVLWLGMTVGFATLYFLLSTFAPEHGLEPINHLPPVQALLNTMYFSVITATTTGLGDILPLGLSKALTCVQSVFAYFVFGICISKLVSNRQELSLQQVHRLTFEDVFHNIREGLFIVRKDFDRLMQKCHAHTAFDAEDWEDLATAYQQTQSLLSEIPDFYDFENGLYTIDEKREALLLEAVHRTLHRLDQLLDSLIEEKCEWQKHGAEDVQELTTLVTSITASWEEKSPYGKEKQFASLVALNDSIQKKIR